MLSNVSSRKPGSFLFVSSCNQVFAFFLRLVFDPELLETIVITVRAA